MTTDVIPILHVADAAVAATWYRRLGFVVEFEHRFGPGFPAYVGIRREGAQIHLSEHEGDARPDTLVHVWVDDVAELAALLGITVEAAPWAREIDVVDPDGNRLRIGTSTTVRDTDGQLGAGTVEMLVAGTGDLSLVAGARGGTPLVVVATRERGVAPGVPPGDADGVTVFS